MRLSNLKGARETATSIWMAAARQRRRQRGAPPPAPAGSPCATRWKNQSAVHRLSRLQPPPAAAGLSQPPGHRCCALHVSARFVELEIS